MREVSVLISSSEGRERSSGRMFVPEAAGACSARCSRAAGESGSVADTAEGASGFWETLGEFCSGATGRLVRAAEGAGARDPAAAILPSVVAFSPPFRPGVGTGMRSPGDGAAGACLPPEAGAETSPLACAGGGVCAVGAASASGCLPRGGAETAGACGRAEAEREAAVAGAGVPGLRQRAPRGSGKTSITTRRASGRLTM